MGEKLDEWRGFLERHWDEPWGLIGALVLALGPVEAFLDGNPRYWVGGALVVAVTVVWAVCRRLPRGRRGALNFAVALACDRQDAARILRADFIQTLGGLMDGAQGAGRTLKLLVIPDHIALRLRTTEDALRLRRRSRAQFMLYGRARLRRFAGKDHWFIDLNGIVTHARIPTEVGLRFAREFRSLLPQRVQIEKEIDVLAFELTSQAVALVARYVIGVAAGLSGDLDYAEKLFREVKSRLRSDLRLPAYAKLAKAVPRQLAAVQVTRAGAHYGRWLRTHDATALDQMRGSLESVEEAERGSSQYGLLEAARLFVDGRRSEEALRVLQLHPHGEAAPWVLSVAFLRAYMGDLRGATCLYRSLRHRDTSPQTIAEVEEFLFWLETEEPGNCVANFCLGNIDWYIKGDSELARSEFAKFLTKRPSDRYAVEASRLAKMLAGSPV